MPESDVESNYPRLEKAPVVVVSLTEQDQLRTARLMWASSLFLAFIPGLILMNRFGKGTILHFHAVCSVVSWIILFAIGGFLLGIQHLIPPDFRFFAAFIAIAIFVNPFASAIFGTLLIRTYEDLVNRSEVQSPFIRWIAYKFSGRGD